ncbi:type II toxin-antitoxin system VapB family antitoxin [Luteimicrobium sp. DT211]|uniref:type II toxin-antitoxin system VapB family antitoxin n=1 Tax=Luteimicrobium sp. DT211 TaxID=3393412 RepID=UPI003CEA8907
MSLNIKNEHVHELAREAARLTGQTQTSVIERALEEFLEREKRESEREERDRRVSELLAQMHARVTDADRARARQIMEDMYDENGLPVL